MIWILVTDGHRAHVVVPTPSNGRFSTIHSLGVAEWPHLPPPSPRMAVRRPELQFAVDVAGRLNAAVADGDCQEFLLVAPAAVGRLLRDALTPQASARLVGTLNCDDPALDDDAVLSGQLVGVWRPPVGAADLGAAFPPSAAAAQGGGAAL